MAVEVTMPRLGWGAEDGSLVEWIKRDGDEVRPGDVVCTVEGDKAVNEVESLDLGILRIPPGSPRPGVKVPVGTVLAYLVPPGEAAPFERVGSLTSSPSRTLERVPARGEGRLAEDVADHETERALAGGESPSISPRARRVAAELGVDWLTLTGSGKSGRIVERDVRAALAAAPSVVAAPRVTEETEAARVSPVARRVAGELGVDLEALSRQKPGQRLTRADVEDAARALVASGEPRALAHALSGPHGESWEATRPVATTPSGDEPERTRGFGVGEAPMGNVRRTIARRMAESAHTVAAVTLTTEADATELVRLRELLKRDRVGTDLPVPSYNDLLARAAALALAAHPNLNASLQGDAIVAHERVDVGIAVDTERGLLVPVLRDVGNKSLQQVARESAPLVERARAGRATSEDLAGGTFTITNLGMYEIDAFTPIINLPQGAILGVGRIVSKPVVVDEANETVAVRKMLALSLTFDHRLVDGAPAARFLQEIKRLVERPTRLI